MRCTLHRADRKQPQCEEDPLCTGYTTHALFCIERWQLVQDTRLSAHLETRGSRAKAVSSEVANTASTTPCAPRCMSAGACTLAM